MTATAQVLTLNSNFNAVLQNTGGYPQGTYIGTWPVYPEIRPLVQTYYPVYYGYWNNETTIEKAFRIVQKLMDKKIVQPEKIKDFIELVNEIASVI